MEAAEQLIIPAKHGKMLEFSASDITPAGLSGTIQQHAAIIKSFLILLPSQHPYSVVIRRKI